MTKTLYLAALGVALAGCASSPKLANVIPQPGGVYQVNGIGKSNDIAMKQALYTAEQTCKPQNKRHVVTSQQAGYDGVLSESTNKAVNTAANVAANLAGAYVPTLSTNHDYRVSLTFTCEA
jgi:hypothetical protein